MEVCNASFWGLVKVIKCSQGHRMETCKSFVLGDPNMVFSLKEVLNKNLLFYLKYL